MSLTRLWCLVPSAQHARTTTVHTFVHSCEGVNKGVNVCVNTNCTTKPDPPHNSHMSSTQPHMHGRSTGGLHSVISPPFTPIFTLRAGPSHLSARSERYLRRNAFELEGPVWCVLISGSSLMRLSKRRDPQRPAIYIPQTSLGVVG